jgi:hypothetical protein
MIAERHTTDNRVITLQAKGEDLQRIGITPPLGKDGERIQSTRFVGDRGYVVTFLQKDPLIAIDLADAADPKILGALTIDGFSQYMHPMDDTHLLTIGRNTDANGSDIGLLLQIFDVSDATHPTRTSMFAYAPSGWSEAQSNHKAFTYWVPEGETDGLLAFPYARYDAMFSSTLQVFRVSVAKGFTQLGEIDHTPLYGNCYDVNGYPNYVYQYCQQPEVRRGLFIQDDKDTYVYSLSWGGVLVNALSDLTATTASVPLPAPDYSEHREGTVMTGNVMDSGGGVAVGGGTAGSTGTSTPPSMGTDVKPAPEPAADGGMAMSGG